MIARIVRIIRSADFIQAIFGIALIAGIATCAYSVITEPVSDWRRDNAAYNTALCAPLYARAVTHADSFAIDFFRPTNARGGETCAEAADYLAAHPAPTEQR